jgi:hypothetical protein
VVLLLLPVRLGWLLAGDRQQLLLVQSLLPLCNCPVQPSATHHTSPSPESPRVVL